jgi:hypothetical protein
MGRLRRGSGPLVKDGSWAWLRGVHRPRRLRHARERTNLDQDACDCHFARIDLEDRNADPLSIEAFEAPISGRYPSSKFSGSSRRSRGMMPSSAGRYALLRWVSVFALVAAAVLTSGRAQAGCDHPWVKRAGVPSGLYDLVVLDLGPQAPAPTQELPDRPHRRIPCAGGACSGAPGVPVSTTNATSSRLELWGDLPTEPPPPSGTVARLSPQDCARRPARLVAPVERPPRLVPCV